MSKHPSQLEPAIIVIFGITGDLSKRFLLPALYHLIQENLFHEKTVLLGISRNPLTTEELYSEVELCVNETDGICDPDALHKMHAITSTLQVDMDEAAAYASLGEHLNQIESEHGVCMNRLFYLSVPPQAHLSIIKKMGEANLNSGCQHGQASSRLLIEKPFGYDLASAQELVSETNKVFSEEQLFRIDHYLAKETVQNILTFRFRNPIFQPLWNREYIAGIRINASETIGIAGRAHFYEPLGALRDFIQSHLLQLLAIVTMDEPEELQSDSIHAKKQALLAQIQAVPTDQITQSAVRGQYEGYRQEVNNPQSMTETFAAVRIQIASDRWRDVPITLWTGKGLAEKSTEVVITFKSRSDGEVTNRLRFRIQPNEGIELTLLAKKPSLENELQPAIMDFSYRQQFDNHEHPNAYERVLVDAVRGDHTLFATSQEVLEAWRVLQPIVAAWSQDGEGLISYPQGTPGEDLCKQLV